MYNGLKIFYTILHSASCSIQNFSFIVNSARALSPPQRLTIAFKLSHQLVLFCTISEHHLKEGFYIRLDYQINSLRDRSLITGEGGLVEK